MVMLWLEQSSWSTRSCNTEPNLQTEEKRTGWTGLDWANLTDMKGTMVPEATAARIPSNTRARS